MDRITQAAKIKEKLAAHGERIGRIGGCRPKLQTRSIVSFRSITK